MIPYQFNQHELLRITQITKDFSQQGFIFKNIRFPSIYYGNQSEFEPNVDFKLKPKKDITPDLFGVYRYPVKRLQPDNSAEQEIPFSAISEAGKIILFQDIIEKSSQKDCIDNVRFVVLMHEYGHWLCHWPIYQNMNWHIGFHRNLIKTMETLAQLIAYWACGNNQKLHNTLRWMSPKINNVIDTNDPYGMYIRLIDKNKDVIIRKIGQLRKAWFFRDERMLEFLEADNNDLIDWITKNNHSLDSLSDFQESDFVGIADDYNNLNREMMSTLFPSSDLTSGFKLVNRMLSKNY